MKSSSNSELSFIEQRASIKRDVLVNFLAFCKLLFLVYSTHVDSYVKRNKLDMKVAGSDFIEMPIVRRNVKLSALKKHWFSKSLIANFRDFLLDEILCLLLLFTHVTPYLVIATYFSCLPLKHLSCDMFVYKVEELKVNTEGLFFCDLIY